MVTAASVGILLTRRFGPVKSMTNPPSIHSAARSEASTLAPLFRVPITAYLILFTYSIVLFCLLDYQSLWLDEILQILSTRSGKLEYTEQLTRIGVGAGPLGWLPQLVAIHLFGYSTAVARLPSALAAVASCLTIFFTARELGLRYPLVPAILLGVLPLHFRYALEGRPYAQGVLFSALATLVFIQLIKRQSIPFCIIYAFILVLGIYTQPFTCFTACGHFLWTLTVWRQRRLVYLSAGALAFMVLTFLPWYFYASPLARQMIQFTGVHFQLSWKTPLMLIREITGAGYWGSAILLPLAAVGFYRGCTSAAMKWLLLICSVVPVVCVLLADAVFGYFLAIRQIIFILPPLVLLAADGVSALMHAAHRRVVAATAVLTIVFVGSDIGWLRKPREDWKLGARTVEQLRTEYSACTLYAPPGSLVYYNFFEPRLADTVCGAHSVAEGSVIVAISPYATEGDRVSIQELLKDKHEDGSRVVGKSTIQVFR